MQYLKSLEQNKKDRNNKRCLLPNSFMDTQEINTGGSKLLSVSEYVIMGFSNTI